MAEMCHMVVLISGHVQGVFYRAFASRIAKSLGIKGYVRNCRRVGLKYARKDIKISWKCLSTN